MIDEERLEQLKLLMDEIQTMSFFHEKLERVDGTANENDLAELLKLIHEQCSRIEIKIRKFRKEY
ncbi:MAG: hypothetical protein HPY53_09175 [Brevinematales bacterium]|nr:hypothetical protein [Brevinematales bacterium]